MDDPAYSRYLSMIMGNSVMGSAPPLGTSVMGSAPPMFYPLPSPLYSAQSAPLPSPGPSAAPFSAATPLFAQSAPPIYTVESPPSSAAPSSPLLVINLPRPKACPHPSIRAMPARNLLPTRPDLSPNHMHLFDSKAEQGRYTDAMLLFPFRSSTRTGRLLRPGFLYRFPSPIPGASSSS